MAVGIIIVCLTASKRISMFSLIFFYPMYENLNDMIYSDAKCEIDFKRTVQSGISYDSRPQRVAIAHLNEDQHQDLVIANTAIDQIAIRFGYGDGSFAEQISYSTGAGSRPYWMAVQDFNNDHLLDIAVANYGSHTIGIFLGRGNGTFSNQMTFSVGASQPVSLDVGDFNGDNQLDIAVVTNGTFDLVILYGRGDGSFETGISFSMAYDSMPCSIAVDDLNRDNRSDIVVVNYGTSELVLFLSNENSTFISNSYSTGTNAHPSSVVVDYFDGDAYLDIAVANSATYNIGVFLGDGNGQLTVMKTYSVSSNAYLQFIVSGQFDDDGNCDLAVLDSTQSNLIIFKGSKNGVFTLATEQSTGYGSRPYSMIVADFNDDNQSDLIIVNNNDNDLLLFSSYMFHIKADQSLYQDSSKSGPIYINTADTNMDGHLDIIVTNTFVPSIGVFIGFGNGTFQSQEITSLSDEPDLHATGDFNKDEKLDIAVLISIYGHIEIYFGLGNGRFEYGDVYSLKWGSKPVSIVITDFDNDGYLDIASINRGTNDVALLFGLGDGSFLDATYYSLPEDVISPKFIATADFNNDSFSDLVVAKSTSCTLTILLNNGYGGFPHPVNIKLRNYCPDWIGIGDLNNDVRQDMVLTSATNNIALVILGKGDGTFSNGYTYVKNNSVSLWDAALADFNKDHIPDIAVIDNLESSVAVFFRTMDKNSTQLNTVKLPNTFYPECIAAGDFNKDNETDIVVAHTEDSMLIVLLMKYQASFTNQATYDQGSAKHPYSITMGDFDNDNKLDIAVANAGKNNVEVLMEYGNEVYSNHITLLTGDNSYPCGLVAADFDQNHRLDLAVVNYRKHNMMVFLNPYNKTSMKSFVYSTGIESFPNAMSTGDFNNDGWTDVVVTNNNKDTVGVFLGFNYPTFIVNDTIEFLRDSSAISVVIADFNNDSFWDLAVVLRFANLIQVLAGQRDGTFRNLSSYSVCSDLDLITLVTGDFNNDNYTDLTVACSGSATIQILLGDGNGAFPTSITEFTGDVQPIFITSDDFNRDGILDIVTVDYTNANIGIFLGYGNGSLAQPILYQMPDLSGPTWIASGDLNSDNILDLVVANKIEDNIRILLGTGDGTFNSLSEYSTEKNSGPFSIALGDFDKDNCTDVAVLNDKTTNVAIFFGYGNGTFSSPVTYAMTQNSILTSIITEDLNNDTILDLAISSSIGGSSNVDIFYGLGGRRFLVPKTYSLDYAVQWSSIAVKDLNNDGRIDIVMSMTDVDKVVIMLADVSEPFGSSVTFSAGTDSGPCAVAVSDLNNDAQLDLAVANSKTNNILILLGDGNGNFFSHKTYRVDVNAVPTSITIGDVDGDKQPDILVTNSDRNEIGIFFSDGNGAFAVVRTLSTGSGSEPSSISIADLNKDNLLDIVVANTGISTIVIFYGIGNQTFLQGESYSLGYNYRPRSVAIGDVNNDGWLDIGIANYESGTVDVLLHTCDRGHSVV